MAGHCVKEFGQCHGMVPAGRLQRRVCERLGRLWWPWGASRHFDAREAPVLDAQWLLCHWQPGYEAHVSPPSPVQQFGLFWSAGEGSYSPNSSTLSGVLPDRPVPFESCPFTELGGIQCPFWLDGDVKHHLRGFQYAVLRDRSVYASCYKLCVTGDRAELGWCLPGVLVGIVHLRVPESHTAGQRQSIGDAGLRFEGWLRIRYDQHALSCAVLVPPWGCNGCWRWTLSCASGKESSWPVCPDRVGQGYLFSLRSEPVAFGLGSFTVLALQQQRRP